MAIFEAIVKFFESILGSSSFADSVHKLFTDMGKADDTAIYDKAVQTAAELLQDGWNLASTAARVSRVHGIADEHAMAVTAAASSQLKAQS